jgi:hypothetical protein
MCAVGILESHDPIVVSVSLVAGREHSVDPSVELGGERKRTLQFAGIEQRNHRQEILLRFEAAWLKFQGTIRFRGREQLVRIIKDFWKAISTNTRANLSKLVERSSANTHANHQTVLESNFSKHSCKSSTTFEK